MFKEKDLFKEDKFSRYALRPGTDFRGPIPTAIDEATFAEKSPFVEGFVTALKAAAIGAPMTAGIQALRGKDPVSGAIAGALLPGLTAGLLSAAKQKASNLRDEAVLRYHANRIKEREPYFFMPPRPYLGQLFTRRLG
jgi:hypothetical protein